MSFSLLLRTCSICLMVFLTIPASAQDIISRLDFGKKDPQPEFFEYSPLDKGLITLGPTNRRTTRFYSLTKYDQEFELQWTEQVFEQNGRRHIDFVAVIGPRILIFISEYFPREKVIKTFYTAYSLEGELEVEKEILSVYPNQKEQKVDLQYTLSPNKRKLLCYKNLQSRKGAEKVLYYLFDEYGEYVSNGEITLNYPDNRYRVRSLRVSNEGNVFMLGKFFVNTRINSADDFKYMIHRYDVVEESMQEIQIELGDRFITDLAFRLDRTENIYIAGFYSNRGTDQIAGTVLQKISRSGELMLDATDPFSEAFLRQYLTNNQINKGKELRNFFLDPEQGIVLRSDGGVLLIAENFFVTVQSYRDMYGAWIDRELYHYEDVILTSVASDGTIEWHGIVDKSQQSESQANLSYFSAIGPAGIFIFYEYQPRRENFDIYYNKISVTGSVEDRKPLLSDYRYGNEFYPRFCEQINNREALMVYVQNRGKMFSVVKVRLDSSD
ncbi:hypothetical protein [Pontibacter sp. G13]|uniref:hypothetical protein n=1 Tax=Pontibacter sp. G13 TaxID=3074898 RepID=UPI00288929C5|nr:hypothetical protein [Pontibacter sp. G13]WNJ21154.1 hypothetical protein RJD25_11860 [Pontibacter sp. G13]